MWTARAALRWATTVLSCGAVFTALPSTVWGTPTLGDTTTSTYTTSLPQSHSTATTAFYQLGCNSEFNLVTLGRRCGASSYPQALGKLDALLVACGVSLPAGASNLTLCAEVDGVDEGVISLSATNTRENRAILANGASGLPSLCHRLRPLP
jgi:hypothetical protein